MNTSSTHPGVSVLAASQAGLYQEATRAAMKVNGHPREVAALLFASAYEQDDMAGAATGGACLGCLLAHNVT